MTSPSPDRAPDEIERKCAEIEARASAASPAPWIQTRNIAYGVKIWSQEDGSPPLFQSIAGVKHSHITDADPIPQWQKDCDFVRCSRADVPWLLATLRETRRELAAIRGERETTGGCRAGVVLPNGDTGTR